MFIKLACQRRQCLGHCCLCARNMHVNALSERTCRPAQSAALLSMRTAKNSIAGIISRFSAETATACDRAIASGERGAASG